MLARQGEEREWHFAHSTADASTQDTTVCDYSAFVSIRLMAHQLLRDLDKMRLPCAPGETELEHRTVELGGREVGVHFHGVAVDAVVLIQDAPLVLYFTHPTRDVPSELYELEGDRVGALRIDLESLPRFYNQDIVRHDGMRLDRTTLKNWLQSAVEAKSWIYHPRQKALAEERARELARQTAERAAAKPAPQPDNRPLMAHYHCTRCDEKWVGGFDDEGMKTCLKCRSADHVRMAPKA
jgi:hypothetical protein